MLRSVVKDLRRLYDGKQSQEMFTLVSNDVELNSDQALFDWLHGFEYHRDEEKRQRIEATYGPLPQEAVQAFLISMLIDKLRAIVKLAAIVSILVSRTKKLKMQVG